MRNNVSVAVLSLLALAPAFAGAVGPGAPASLVEVAMVGRLPPGAMASPEPGAIPFLAEALWPADDALVGPASTPTVHVGAFPLGGDADGDARPDVLVVTTTLRGRSILSSLVELRSGSDGDLVWSRGFGEEVAWSAYLPGDVTGNGAPDLAFVTFEDATTTWVWPPPGMSGLIEDFTYLSSATRRLLLVDGATGESPWEVSRETTTLLAGRIVYPMGFWAQLRVQQNLQHGNAVEHVGDVDADGVADVLWQPWDLVFTNVEHARTTHASIFGGATGATLFERTLVGSVPSEWSGVWGAASRAYLHAPVARAFVGPDADGDGLPELLTAELRALPEGAALLARASVDPRSGGTRWTRTDAAGDAARVPAGGFAPLAGPTPRALWTLGAGAPLAIELLDAATGATRWSASAVGLAAYALPAGDADADGAEDVLVGVFGAEGAPLLVLALLSGATGDAVWARAVEGDLGGEAAQGIAFAPPEWDHDGDGARDFLLWEVRIEDVGSVTERWSLVRASDGLDAWSDLRASESFRIHASVPDLSQDALADVLQVGFDAAGTGVRLAAIRGQDATPVWAREPYRALPGASGWSLALACAGDADGDGAHDLLLRSEGWSAEAMAPPRIETLSGASGAGLVAFLEG